MRQLPIDSLSSCLESAFYNRRQPENLPEIDNMGEGEEDDLRAFFMHDWRDISEQDIIQCCDAYFWFDTAFFVFYLPSLLRIVTQTERIDYSIYDYMVASLDRSPEPDYWDAKFL